MNNPRIYSQKYYESRSRPEAAFRPTLPLYGRSIGSSILISGRRSFSTGIKNNFIEIQFTISGSGTVTLFHQEFPQKPGSVFIYYPGEEHCQMANSDLWKIRWLTIDGPLAMAILTAYNYPRHQEFPLEFTNRKLDEIEQVITKSSSYGFRKTSALILELLSYSGEEQPISHDDSTHELIQAAIRHMRDNLSNYALNVNSIADYLGIHRTTFSRLFYRQLHISPHSYIASMRLEQAKALLVGTRLSIARIAKSCGYRDSTTFCRLFRHKLHTTPLQYRNCRGGGTVAPEALNSVGTFQPAYPEI